MSKAHLPLPRVPYPRGQVIVRDGTFAGMQGQVVQVLENMKRVRVLLTIFARPVPVELEDWQVELVLETEEEWQTCTNPTAMVAYLTSARKQRLFACACVLHAPGVVEDRICREILAVSERYADGEAGRQELIVSQSRLTRVERKGRVATDAVEAVLCAASTRPADVNRAHLAALRAWWMRESEVMRQCALLRDVRGNPFRPVTASPSWLRWNDGTVAKMANAIYEGRHFAELPILADALEDAGCTDPDVLSHCRSGTEHVRG
jgi:hypothetical protein